MRTTCIAAAMTIALALNSTTHAIRLREYRRPQCTSEQTCSYEAFGMIFALCDCPGDDPICPRDPRNAIEHRGTVYNFCYPRSAPICEDGQVSTTVSGIQTAIHCICSDSNDLVQQPTKLKDVTSYMCRQRRLCNVDEACGLRSFVGEMRICDCRPGMSCVYSSVADASFSRQAGKCRGDL